MDEEVSKKEDNQEEAEEEKEEEEKEESKPKPDNESEKEEENKEPEKKKEDIQEVKEKVKKDKFEKMKEYKNNLTDKMRKNPWIVSTFLLGVFMLVIIITGSSGITGGTVSSTEVGNNLIEYLNEVADSEVTLIDVEDEGNMYLVTIEFKGEEMPFYVTKDGEYYTMNLVPISSGSGGTKPQPSEGYSEEDFEKISTFIDCLAEKDVKIYGANWCGWTKKLVVETFGGFDVAAPIYVECTDPENEEICSQMVDTGYPTIRVNEELYEGSRTFEGFAEATGCPVPDVNSVQSSTEEATC